MNSTRLLSAYSSLLLEIYRQAQEKEVQKFQDDILEVLKHYVPFDSSMWGTATMTAAGIDIHSIHLHNSSQAMLEAYDKVKHQDLAAVQVAQQPTVTLSFNVDTVFASPACREIRQFCHDFGHENYFITSDINPLTKFAQWVSLFRANAAQVCTDEEVEFLGQLAPHLMQALAINRLVHLHRVAGDSAREKWSVAIADGKGVLYHADERFKNLIRSEWRCECKDGLPQELLGSLLGENDQFTGKRVLVRRTLEQGLLFLKAREVENVDSLSAREFLVARLLASGLTQKQVAAKLQRSPETIRSQVKCIFDKLQINNVAVLAPLLAFRD